MLDYDVAIAGGGPAGAAAAIILANAGRRVLLANAKTTLDFRIGEGLPPNARSLLEELGVLSGMAGADHRPSPGTLAYWGNDRAQFENTIFQLHGHGWILDRCRFDAMMRDAARSAGAEVRESASFRLLQAGDSATAHRVIVRECQDDDRIITARWVIDASGWSAGLSRRFGATRIVYDPLFAFYQKLYGGAGTDMNACITVEAVDDGWWYSALLPAEFRLIAYFGAPAAADRRRLLDTDGLWQSIAKAPRLQALCLDHDWRPHGRARAAVATSAALDKAAGERWLAVGDAALSFDPLSSKGISNALYTGIYGARCMLAAQAGDGRATGIYSAHLREIHQAYREQLRALYAAERRWRGSDFWRRRGVYRHPIIDQPDLGTSIAWEADRRARPRPICIIDNVMDSRGAGRDGPAGPHQSVHRIHDAAVAHHVDARDLDDRVGGRVNAGGLDVDDADQASQPL